MTIYVLTTPVTAPTFADNLASVVRRHGLTPSVGRATDDKGHILHVLEAKGRQMRLWSQNMPLSGHEDRAICGEHAEAYPDPGQFMIVVKPTLPFLGNRASIELITLLRQELSQLGYEIRETPALCSPLAKSALDRP
jgi:hypothetical protein